MPPSTSFPATTEVSRAGRTNVRDDVSRRPSESARKALVSRVAGRLAAAVLVVATVGFIMGQVVLSFPFLADLLPEQADFELRRFIYEGWNLFAPPPRAAPELIVRCEKGRDNHTIVELRVLADLAARAREHRFGAATRVATYAFSVARQYLRATATPRDRASPFWQAEAAEAVELLRRLGVTECRSALGIARGSVPINISMTIVDDADARRVDLGDFESNRPESAGGLAR